MKAFSSEGNFEQAGKAGNFLIQNNGKACELFQHIVVINNYYILIEIICRENVGSSFHVGECKCKCIIVFSTDFNEKRS